MKNKKEKLKVIFIGGLTNGVIVYDYLSKNKFIDLKLTITYKDSDEKKPRFVKFADTPKVIKSSNANKYFEEIKNINPDLIIVAGWSELLKKELIDIPRLGTIGFHPSKLPKDRGRSVLAWQIEEGYLSTALTMFYYTNSPDAGDIIGQEIIEIEFNDTINNILDKCDEVTYNMMYAYFPLIKLGIAPRINQNEKESNFRRLRKSKDSIINWNSNAKNIYNKVRAITQPYPGAEFKYNSVLVKVWECDIVNDINILKKFNEFSCGSVLAKMINNIYWIKCKDGIIKINTETDLKVGSNLCH